MAFVNRKQDAAIRGLSVLNMLGIQSTKGEVGLELEMEGNTFCKNNDALYPLWVYHTDHSLRGHDNAEYVLRKPLPFADIPGALDALWAVLAKTGTVLDVSNRTSVHVHLNCQSFFLNRLASLMAIYFTVEELLADYCGEHRKGNLFCLTARDAPGIITQITQFLKSDGSNGIPDNLHYAGFNIQALQKFGSVEIRTMRGATNPQMVQDWVNILQKIYDKSALYADPRSVCALFSEGGPQYFLNEVFEEQLPVLLAGVSMTSEEISDRLYEGIRLAQDFCYFRDWSRYEPVNIKRDPFGRSVKKVMAAMSTSTGEAPYDPFDASVAALHPTIQQTITIPASWSDPQPIPPAPLLNPSASLQSQTFYNEYPTADTIPDNPFDN